jgi:hypothetical protein
MPFIMKSIADTKDFQSCEIERIITLITGKGLADEDRALYEKTLNTGISIRKEKDPEKQKRLKKTLPCFGVIDFAGHVSATGFVSTQYIMFDIDHLTSLQELNIVKGQLQRFSFLYFKSIRQNGFKFVIKLTKPIAYKDYKPTCDEYRPYFSSLLGVDLDPAYSGYQTYFSTDADAGYNPDSIEFEPITATERDEVASVDPDSIVDDEIQDIAEALKGVYFNNSEWVRLGLAFSSVGRRGEIPFKSLETADKERYDHADRDYNKQWDWCLRHNRSIGFGTLLHIADHRAGYKRKTQYILASKKVGFPEIFDIMDDGRCYYAQNQTDRPLAFSFDRVEYLYRLYTEDLTNEGDTVCLNVYRVSGYSNALVRLKGSELNSYIKFRDKIREASDGNGEPLECFCGTEQQERTVYQAMQKYFMALQRGGKTKMTEKLGIGCVTGLNEWERYGFAIWNLGNVVMIIRKTDNGFSCETIPYERYVTIPAVPRHGRMDDVIIGLENFSNSQTFPDFRISENQNLREDIRKFLSFYDDGGLFGLFWVVAQANYKFYPDRQFPVLYIWGQSRMGKTSMADLLVSMYGAGSAVSLTALSKNMAAGLTPTGYLREREKINSVPIKIDEVGKYPDRTRDIILASYDGVGKTHAMKSNDLETKATRVNGSCVLMSIEASNNDQIYSRCIHIKIEREDKPSLDFTSFYQNRKALSNFVAFMLTKYSPDDFNEQYRKSFIYLCNLLLEHGVDSRMSKNLAFMHMAYVFCNEQGFVGKLGDSFWIAKATGADKLYGDQNDVSVKILNIAKQFADPTLRGKYHGIISREIFDGYEEIGINLSSDKTLQEILTVLRQDDRSIEIQSVGKMKEALLKSRFILPHKDKAVCNQSMIMGTKDYRTETQSQEFACPKCGTIYTQYRGGEKQWCSNPDCSQPLPVHYKATVYHARYKIPSLTTNEIPF